MNPAAHMSPKNHKKSDTLRILGRRLENGVSTKMRRSSGAVHRQRGGKARRVTDVRDAGMPCAGWRRVEHRVTSGKLRPTPANSWCREGRRRPGAERVTPCLPGRRQQALWLLDTATRRR
jgi:hypothetical protein